MPREKQLYDMAQRVAIQVAALPLDKRDAGFQAVEKNLRDMVVQVGIAKDVDAFTSLLMQVVRETVQKIDAGGSPQGGNA